MNASKLTVWPAVIGAVIELSSVSSLLGCAPPGQGTKLGITRAALEALPQVPQVPGEEAEATPTSIAAYPALASFFEQECFMPGGDDFCPAGTDVSGGTSNPRKFTPMTLLGLIYHAEMYSGGLQTSCWQEVVSVDENSFVAHASAGAEPSRFLLDDFELLSCLERAVNQDPRVMRLSSVDPDGRYQATLTTRYRVPFEGLAEPGQTDIFQVDVSYADGVPVFLAFNFAGANTMFSRAVLLANLVDHRFAVKYRAAGDPGASLVSAGIGGVDRATGAPHAGYYFVAFTDASGPLTRCVDNADGHLQPDLTACTAGGVPTDWEDASAVREYLGLTPTVGARVKAWLDVLASDALLPEDASPTNAAPGGDPELYFPERVR